MKLPSFYFVECQMILLVKGRVPQLNGLTTQSSANASSQPSQPKCALMRPTLSFYFVEYQMILLIKGRVLPLNGLTKQSTNGSS